MYMVTVVKVEEMNRRGWDEKSLKENEAAGMK